MLLNRWAEDEGLSLTDFDLGQIFIGREQQQYLFEIFEGIS